MNSRARGLLRFPVKLQQKFSRNCRLGQLGVLLFILQLVLSRFHVNIVVVVAAVIAAVIVVVAAFVSAVTAVVIVVVAVAVVVVIIADAVVIFVVSLSSLQFLNSF